MASLCKLLVRNIRKGGEPWKNKARDYGRIKWVEEIEIARGSMKRSAAIRGQEKEVKWGGGSQLSDVLLSDFGGKMRIPFEGRKE